MDKKINRSIQFKSGALNYIITLIVIAIVVIINMIVNSMPASTTSWNISDTDFYEISDSTKDYLKKVNNNVEIYLLSDSAGSYDEYAENISGVFASYNKKISLKKIDLASNPSFVLDYKLSSSNTADAIIVKNIDNGKYRAILSSNYYYQVSSYDDFGQKHATWNYDGEGQLLSAISYVTSEVNVLIYELTGHGELEIANTSLKSALDKSNYSVSETKLELNKIDAIPEDCDVLFISSPSKDFTEIEADKIIKYCEKGGNLIIIYNKLQDLDTPNIDNLIKANGLDLVPALVYENDGNYYYASSKYPNYTLLPEISKSSEITKELVNNKSLAFYCSPIKKATTNHDVTYNELLLTSKDHQVHYIKDDFKAPEYEKVSIATYATNNYKDGTKSQTLLVGCCTFLEEIISDSSVLNTNNKIITNSIKEMTGDNNSILVDAKTLEDVQNTPTKNQSILLIIIYVALIPLFFLVVGICNYVLRQSKG